VASAKHPVPRPTQVALFRPPSAPLTAGPVQFNGDSGLAFDAQGRLFCVQLRDRRRRRDVPSPRLRPTGRHRLRRLDAVAHDTRTATTRCDRARHQPPEPLRHYITSSGPFSSVPTAACTSRAALTRRVLVRAGQRRNSAAEKFVCPRRGRCAERGRVLAYHAQTDHNSGRTARGSDAGNRRTSGETFGCAQTDGGLSSPEGSGLTPGKPTSPTTYDSQRATSWRDFLDEGSTQPW